MYAPGPDGSPPILEHHPKPANRPVDGFPAPPEPDLAPPPTDASPEPISALTPEGRLHPDSMEFQMSVHILRELYGITHCEARVFALLLEGYRLKDIGSLLNVTRETVRTHLSRVFDVTALRSQPRLVRGAFLSTWGDFRKQVHRASDELRLHRPDPAPAGWPPS